MAALLAAPDLVILQAFAALVEQPRTELPIARQKASHRKLLPQFC